MRLLLLLLASGCVRGDPAVEPPCPEPLGAPAEDLPLSSHPWAQLRRGGVRLRVEVHDDLSEVPIQVGLDVGCPLPADVTSSTVARTFAWPTSGAAVPWPDRPGPHTLHEAFIDGMLPGERYRWTVHAGPTQTLTGSFRAPPEPGASFTAVFVGDTMSPVALDVHQAMGRLGADLYLHGGDLQYQTAPEDTWAGSMWAASPVLRTALFHLAPGDHEHEGQDEFDQVYRRWFGGAGDAGRDGYHAIDYAGVRFLLLDSEHGLRDPDSAQVAWLTEQLAEAAAMRTVVPVFHRPARTLGNHAPRTDIRAVLEPLFRAHDVRLVLSAHNHAYERFDAEGISWIVEGGGGAALTDVDAHVAAWPDEVADRRAASRTHGFLHLSFDAHGVDLVRYRPDGLAVDRRRVPLPALAP